MKGVAPPAHDPAEDLEGLFAQRERFLAFLRRRTPDTASAEDVLQAAYLKALASRATLRDRSSVVRWFFQILQRAAVDHHRRGVASARAVAGLRARASASRQEEALRSAVCACVEGLLPGLPGDQAEILRRVDLEGATPAEAAASLGLTPGNAAVRLHRARKALRAPLEAVCGACTRHRCLDCHCKPARR